MYCAFLLQVYLIQSQEYKTIEQAKLAILEYIEIWYNRKRTHLFRLKTPVGVEIEFNKTKNVA